MPMTLEEAHQLKRVWNEASKRRLANMSRVKVVDPEVINPVGTTQGELRARKRQGGFDAQRYAEARQAYAKAEQIAEAKRIKEKQAIKAEFAKFGQFKTKDQIIVSEVSRYYKVSKSEILGKTRQVHVCHARQVAMYLIYTMTNCTLPMVGKRTGRTHHTTVLHAVNKITRLIGENTETAHAIQTIRNRVEEQI